MPTCWQTSQPVRMPWANPSGELLLLRPQLLCPHPARAQFAAAPGIAHLLMLQRDVIDCKFSYLFAILSRGLGGPHDSGTYNSSAWDTGFFVSDGGNWDSEYGRFFLSW